MDHTPEDGVTYAYYRLLLDQSKPATLLSLLPEGAPPVLAAYRAEALLDLDRTQEARDYLDPQISQLEGDDFSSAERCWAQVLLRQGWFDGGILAAESAAQAARRDDLQAAALALSAIGFAYKRCWKLSAERMRRALELDPNQPQVLIAQARIRLEADQRIEARKVYERLAQTTPIWTQAYAHWGLAHVAYLLGEFEQARHYGEAALGFSSEIVLPLFGLAQVALAQQDILYLEWIINELERRSPQAEGFPGLKSELAKLRQRLATEADPLSHSCRRLKAFPTLVQRRDYCGPSTVELVLRYWRGGSDLSNDQIAESVKFPQSGTPIYRMREFFHLVGFDTVRTLAPVEKLKKLIDAGYPVITQEEFSNSSHVAVVIGYDDQLESVELQDPMTHIVTSTPYGDFDRLRRSYLNSVVVAFPRNDEHEKALARMNLFDNPVIVWTDQAVLEMDQNHPESAAELMQRAVKRLPAHTLSWIMLLHAEMERWRAARQHITYPKHSLAERLNRKDVENPAKARKRFYAALKQARKFHPKAEFIYSFNGNAALLENDVPRALAAFQRACELDPDDARNYASIAECYYSQRDFVKAQEAAWKALQHDQSLPAANVWVARCLAERGEANAIHYAAVAAELVPDWWLAHLALAETYFQQRDYDGARRSVEYALALAPGNPEVVLLRAELLSLQGDHAGAALETQAALDNPLPLSLQSTYRAHQLLCRLMFGSGLFEEAREQVKQVLAVLPQDPWAVQFALAAECESLLQEDDPPEEHFDEAGREEFYRRYEQAVEANQAAFWVAEDYLDYCSRLISPAGAVEAAARLRSRFPDQGAMVFLLGRYQARIGQGEAAANTMMEALASPDSVRNRDELYELFNIVLDGLGLEAGEQALLDAPVREGSAPAFERRRALGLALAQHGDSAAERARQLLRGILGQSGTGASDDAYAWLRLGDVAEDEAEQENCYRHALIAAPGWAFARANLARFLVHQNRYGDALEFTAGYEEQSQEMLMVHGQALIGIGYYEEAANLFTRALDRAGQPSSNLYYDKWYAEMECGWHEGALKTARQAHKLFGTEPAWQLRIAESLRELERFEQAYQVLAECLENGLEEVEVLHAQFELARREKDEVNAWSILRQVIELEPESNPLQLSWAEERLLALFLENGRADDARSLLGRKQLTPSAWGSAAWIAMATDEHEFTLELAQHTLALDPENYAGLYANAQALIEMGREELAVQALQALREAHPNEHNAYEKLALYSGTKHQMEEALELADRAVQLGPFCPSAWAVRGFVYFAIDQPAEALADLQMAWNRADSRRRLKSAVYWWIMAELQEDGKLASEMRKSALEMADTELDQRMIALVETRLAEKN